LETELRQPLAEHYLRRNLSRFGSRERNLAKPKSLAGRANGNERVYLAQSWSEATNRVSFRPAVTTADISRGKIDF
jgi:hypothetical protein